MENFSKKKGGTQIEFFRIPTSPNWSKKLLAEAVWVNLFFCKGFMVSNTKLKLDKFYQIFFRTPYNFRKKNFWNLNFIVLQFWMHQTLLRGRKPCFWSILNMPMTCEEWTPPFQVQFASWNDYHLFQKKKCKLFSDPP